MLQIGDKDEKRYLDPDDLLNFPCEELQTINDLWVKYSDGKFGFTLQKQIWLDCGGGYGKNEYEAYKKFHRRVRWNELDKERYMVNEHTPTGHLPYVGSLVWNNIQKTQHSRGYLFSRTEACRL